jgi:esterase/lipase superfamily enzyme
MIALNSVVPRMLAIAAVLTLVACSARPPPALTLTTAVPQASPVVQLLVATTRRRSTDPAELFSGERTLSPNFARLAISIPVNRETGEITWSNSTAPDPTNAFAATAFSPFGKTSFGAEISKSVRKSGKSHVLLFVHGYNTRFDEAAFRLAQIVHDAGASVTPVLFSWPSWGTLSAYPYDRESAAMSRDGLESVLAMLAKEPSVSQVSVLAHSMGGWLTLEALRQIAIRDRQINPKITDVMLAAPDVDVDVALSQGRALSNITFRPRLTLFVSADDKALNVSRFVWGSRDRLGSIDPRIEPYRTNLAKGGVEVFDLTDVNSSDSLNHGKFAASPAVVRLIGTRLAKGQQLQGQHTAGDAANILTQGTVKVLGDVITAPLRLGTPAHPGEVRVQDVR